MTAPSCFQRLGISPSSGEREIKKAYKRLALKTHPDKVPAYFVHEVSVHDDYQRQGIATRLMRRLAELAGDRGCEVIWVATAPGHSTEAPMALRSAASSICSVSVIATTPNLATL